MILARNAFYDRIDVIGPDVLLRVEGAVDAVVSRQNTLGPAGAAKARNAIMIVAGFVAVGVISGLVLAYFTGHSVSVPLRSVTQGMGRLAEGDLDVEIDPPKDDHEIGKMTKAMIVFLENARRARDLDLEVKAKEEAERERQAAEQKREAEREREKQTMAERARAEERASLQVLENFQKDMEHVMGEAARGDFTNRMPVDLEDQALVSLAKVINALMQETEKNIDDIVRSIGALSNGNLGIRIEGERSGSFDRMKNDFNAAVSNLSLTMGDIKNSGDSVANTSAHLEKSAQEMAARAEHAAAAVEETSAAVEEISARIRQVVENANAANQANQKARESANQTRKVSNETEQAINAMTQASEEIDRVVKVIEDIAFQINLLALNAGVEAARAGEAGQGFSVVASEVRALAQRSQDAVKEIADVIQRNAISVETGVEKVALSRAALEDIISDVEIASEQVSGIASAVEKQSGSIDEIKVAVASIDSAAQTNAASLQEMTAASASMNKDAIKLAENLQQFHGVSNAAAPSAEPLRLVRKVGT